MKKSFSLCTILLFCCASDILAKAAVFSKRNNSVNNLQWVEVSDKRFAPQVMFDFSNPLYFEKRVDNNKMQLEISFPGVQLKAFRDQKVVEKIRALKGFVNKVELSYLKVPSPRVVLTITFKSKDFLVRWNKIEDPNRLTIDIFSKDLLRKLKGNGATILQAQNYLDEKKKSEYNNKYNFNDIKKNIRVVVDAGHGGDDPGAKGFYLLKEKDIALDIARRTKDILKKNGFNIFLTRNDDKDLSLLQRNELATQLQADLLVSIHVNAIKGVERVNGMETYYLDRNSVVPSAKTGGFLFVSNKLDNVLANKANYFMQKNLELSKNLACNIQKSITQFCENKKIDAVDRGVKAAKYRILLRSEVPVALVEVGFLTNKKEAKRLATPAYRQMLAYGISQGIKKYIHLQK